MSSFTQYLWGIYLVAALGLITMLWYSLRNAGSVIVQDVPVVLALALLLTPCSALPGSSTLAPALVALVIEGLFDAQLNIWRGGVPILLAAVSLLMLLFAKYWIVARFRKGDRRAPDTTLNNGSAMSIADGKIEPEIDVPRPRSKPEPKPELAPELKSAPGPEQSTTESTSSVKNPAVDPN